MKLCSRCKKLAKNTQKAGTEYLCLDCLGEIVKTPACNLKFDDFNRIMAIGQAAKNIK